jgi:hypothetical protein
VLVVALVFELGARDGDLLCVDHDHEITNVDVRRVDRLALAAQGIGQLGGETTEVLALGVDDEPVALAIGRLAT